MFCYAINYKTPLYRQKKKKKEYDITDINEVFNNILEVHYS